MSDDWKAYVEDPRTVCKYGKKCYQKNTEHHANFKHPPDDAKRKVGHKRNKIRFKPYARAAKTSEAPENLSTEQVDTNHQSADEKPLHSSHDKNLSNASTNLFEDHSRIKNKLPKNISFFNIGNTDNKVFKDMFLVEMPTDFFKFYECLKSENNYENVLSSVNLQLIGPFDLLNGKLPMVEDSELYLIHWRFYYDPPEFQPVFKTLGNSEYHVGYFRDDPTESPVFVAGNNSAKDCHITPMADNIFGAIYFHLENEKHKSPFTSLACQKLMDKVKKWAEEHNYPIQKFDLKKRLSTCLTRTLNGAGIMVPYNKKTQLGYRPLVQTDANLKKLFQKLSAASTQEEKDKLWSEIQPVITYANIAVDECDFGTGLEMGLDLFCSGLKEMEPSALSCLSSAYTLLERSSFAQIIQAHLKHRRRGPNMSILSMD